jgi:hypothetical protein
MEIGQNLMRAAAVTGKEMIFMSLGQKHQSLVSSHQGFARPVRARQMRGNKQPLVAPTDFTISIARISRVLMDESISVGECHSRAQSPIITRQYDFIDTYRCFFCSPNHIYRLILLSSDATFRSIKPGKHFQSWV